MFCATPRVPARQCEVRARHMLRRFCLRLRCPGVEQLSENVLDAVRGCTDDGLLFSAQPSHTAHDSRELPFLAAEKPHAYLLERFDSGSRLNALTPFRFQGLKLAYQIRCHGSS